MERKKGSIFFKYRKKVAADAVGGFFLVALPTDDSSGCHIMAFVEPHKLYGNVSGRQLIEMYLSKYWKKGTIPVYPWIRQAIYRHKEKRYGHRSLHDIEVLTKKGNEKDIVSFLQHKRRIQGFYFEIEKELLHLGNLVTLEEALYPAVGDVRKKIFRCVKRINDFYDEMDSYQSELTKQAKKNSCKLANEILSWWHETEEESRNFGWDEIGTSEDEILIKSIEQGYAEGGTIKNVV